MAASPRVEMVLSSSTSALPVGHHKPDRRNARCSRRKVKPSDRRMALLTLYECLIHAPLRRRVHLPISAARHLLGESSVNVV